jgi:hypothetical protein
LFDDSGQTRPHDLVGRRLESSPPRPCRRLRADQEKLRQLNVELQRVKPEGRRTYERLHVAAQRAAALSEDLAICESPALDLLSTASAKAAIDLSSRDASQHPVRTSANRDDLDTVIGCGRLDIADRALIRANCFLHFLVRANFFGRDCLAAK